METDTIQDIRGMSEKDIENNIAKIKKTLLDFRIQQATRQSFKPHLVRQYKKQLARIMTIKHEKFLNN
uniref:Large ribosomal subunit protein uL29c n=1 Tax=Liagora brachyclada TaxID=1884665 RepID=A0A1G4P000_9FLOR|nr:Ribosomal protein L29 [Liagora brachyclada]SCW24251.1 Ribosomal protein L29 [Liagora brachyclada]